MAFDTRPLSDPGGIGRYARCLLAALHDTAGPGDEVLEIRRASAASRGGSAELLHTPWMRGAPLRCACPTVVTLHELGALKRRSEHLRNGVRMRLRNLAVQRAAGVIVPTEAVRRDAIEQLHVEDRCVTVIPEAADASMYARGKNELESVRAQFSLPEHYLLWVGDLLHPEPGKHVAQLAAAARGLPLVLVGETRPWAHELPGVILTGNVGDEQLAAIYSGARALVLPSESEGFGLPAVEALACGTPVVACDIPALRDALGDRATFVAPGDMDAMIDAAERTSRPAPAPPAWTWRDAALATWEVYARAQRAAQSPQPLARRAHAHAPRAQKAAAPGVDGLE